MSISEVTTKKGLAKFDKEELVTEAFRLKAIEKCHKRLRKNLETYGLYANHEGIITSVQGEIWGAR
jgi:hypothetical protein